MKYLLFKDRIGIKATQLEKYDMAIKASTGEMKFDEIKLWLQSKTQTINK